MGRELSGVLGILPFLLLPSSSPSSSLLCPLLPVTLPHPSPRYSLFLLWWVSFRYLEVMLCQSPSDLELFLLPWLFTWIIGKGKNYRFFRETTEFISPNFPYAFLGRESPAQCLAMNQKIHRLWRNLFGRLTLRNMTSKCS